MPFPLRQPHSALARPHPWRVAAMATLLAAVVSSSPAPDRKLPSLPSLPSLPNPLPNLFKSKDKELQETARAPTGPGDMCVLPSGEYVVSCHQFFQPRFRVMKQDPERGWVPFPTAAHNTPGSGSHVVLDSVLGLACDSRGIVWMLDNGRRSDTPPKLVAWDTRRNDFHRVIRIGDRALSPRSFLRNIVLDPEAPYIYISDPADGVESAIIVVDTRIGVCRRVLEGHRSTQMDPTIDLELEDRPLEVRRPDGRLATPLTGVSPLAMDEKGEWLYYGPRNGTSLFKIEADLLRRRDIAPHVLENQVKGVSPKPICDSMIVDSNGRIYFGDILNKSIDYVKPDDGYLNLYGLIEDPRIIWPGGLLIAPDGNLHFFSSQLHRTPFFNSGKDVTEPPYSIFKGRPLPVKRFGF